MSKYPYIGEYKETGLIVLFDKPGSETALNSGMVALRPVGSYEQCFVEDAFKDITREYLTKTYGKVESKEHAEFIISLAEKCGFIAGTSERYGFINEDRLRGDYFYCSKVYYGFGSKGFCEDDAKLITLPMPPTDEAVENSNSAEWPQVGDEVLAPFHDDYTPATICWQRDNNLGFNVSLVFNSNYIPFWCATDDLKKPKTPENELRDFLTLLWNENNKDFDDFANIAVEHLTKKQNS